jgi:hypothetical protein
MTALKGYRYGGEDDVIRVAVTPVKAIQIGSARPVPATLSQATLLPNSVVDGSSMDYQKLH